MSTLLMLIAAANALPSGLVEADPKCDLLPKPAKFESRALTAEDLVRLRDIGPANNEMPGLQLIAMSPDQKHIAFQLRRASLPDNRYCLGMLVATLDGSRAWLVDQGGDAIFYDPSTEGIKGLPSGIPLPITPRWSADGRYLFFLKQLNGKISLWRAAADGRGSQVAVSASSDIIDFRILNPETAIISLTRAQPGQDPTERRNGYRFDERFFPMASDRPVLKEPLPPQFRKANLATGKISPASQVEIDSAGFEAAKMKRFPAPNANVALTGLIDQSVPPLRYIDAEIGQRRYRCESELCSSSDGTLWWNKSGTHVRFRARHGWANQEIGIFEWHPQSGHVRSLYSSKDLLLDCQLQNEDQLICLREKSLHPRHIAQINLSNASTNIIWDPNPEFQSLTLGNSRRINLTSKADIPAYADLVLPTDWKQGRKVPLLVVQYQSRGFLRGGIGDEFPIQLYANQGYAVLSMNKPVPPSFQSRPENYIEVDRLSLIDFADRRNILSAIENAVKITIAEGIADPDKIGITGLSDGSSTVQFSALNSSLFTAGVVSGCCWERNQRSLLGPYVAKMYEQIGWPRLSEDKPDFWQHVSLVQNAEHVKFPILFSMPDEEFRNALASYTALREVGKPADMYVFENEHHLKREPAHRFAAYLRSLDWFNFWLRGLWPSDERRRKEVTHWQRMKDEAPPLPTSQRPSGTASDPMASPSFGIEQ